ncbi:PAS domain S-box-containing protein [Archangium gephyra]|uniref:histidine kinase n=1 Tax=Archangium gephyra TaxID=48 RepID=A0AAC8Q3T9_9BACT|nr:PAS domain S-box protein [Archangium gephyra]AKJ00610.1 Chemotaxis protein methyltransferase CheR [Archangium gephyra]REG20659.1 PAS domain S-box-containing protein [Archangium gephyra]
MLALALSARDTLRVRALLADTRRLVWVVDEAGRMQQPSDSWAAFTGQASGQMMGWHWQHAIHPEDRGPLDPEGELLGPGRSNGGEVTFRVRREDDVWRDVQARALPVKDEAGRLVEWLFVGEDITGRASAGHTAEALNESEERFRSLVQTSASAIWTTNAQGRPVEDAPTWRAFTGLTLEQWLDGTSWLEAIHPEDAPAAREAWRNAVTTKTPFAHEYRLRHANGSWRWVVSRAVPVFNLDGGVREWVGTNTDISERKTAEAERDRLLAELETNERLLSAILEQMPSGFLLAGPNGELTYANAQAEAIWGHELIQSPDVKGYAAYHQHRLDGSPYPAEELPLARSVLHGEVVRGEVLWLRRPDKDNRFIKVNCAPIRDERSRTIAAVMVFDNITEARQAEEHAARLQVVTSALSQALTQADVARTVLSVAVGGMGAEAGAVYRQRADGSLESLHDVGYPESFVRHVRDLTPLANNPVVDAVRSGREIWLRSTSDMAARYPEIVTLRASQQDHAVAVFPMWVHGESVGALVLSYPDPRVCVPEELQFLQMLAQQCGQALERARLYEAAEAERQRAEQASRLKDEFLGVLSHELRTPLTAILGWVQILRTRQLPQDKRERALETIERNARAQTQLVEDLLDVNRIVSGRLRLDVRPTNLEKVIESAVDVVRPAAEARGIQLQVSLEPQTVPVQGDPDRLQQVVWNLLSNAVKFTPQEGSVTVSLSWRPAHVELQVRDTGDGIAPGFLPHLFERFTQADASSTRRHGGLGLGLAIVRHLVELHGGTVEAQSAGKGQGATFTVLLPLVAPRAAEAEPARVLPQHPPQLPADYPKALHGRHILVVDDDKDTRELVATLLQEGKARVSIADSAAQALELMNREPPELIISDIGMPGMDGYALIQAVRTRAPELGGRVPAVALTAYARQEDQAAALRAGFDSHVAKPLEPAELLWVLATLLKRS